MIRNYQSQDKIFQLMPPSYYRDNRENNFTVIVGKNGTGKSRLLQGVVSEILTRHLGTQQFEREERVGRIRSQFRSIEFDDLPRKVICVSTSPFDKFPLLRRIAPVSIYSYLGLRGLPSGNLSTAYMARIMASLVTAVARSHRKTRGVIDVLHYLGYDGIIHCTFTVGLPSRIQEEILDARNPLKAIADLHQSYPLTPIETSYQLRQLKDADPEMLMRAVELFRLYKKSGRRPRIDLVLDSTGIYGGGPEIEDLLLLVGTGFARLRDVSLQKSRGLMEPEIFRISEASSGEQSVIMGLLGIASQIEDHSLICIDEPEVCLHPEWQERYVHLLVDTFSNRRNCQFLIATHSPQVVAELPSSACFVMNMDDGIAVDASALSRRSVDFQLAQVFKTPGRHNEFLNRTALNLFSRVSQRKEFSREDCNSLAMLTELREHIHANDPLHDLIIALEALKGLHGRDC